MLLGRPLQSYIEDYKWQKQCWSRQAHDDAEAVELKVIQTWFTSSAFFKVNQLSDGAAMVSDSRIFSSLSNLTASLPRDEVTEVASGLAEILSGPPLLFSSTLAFSSQQVLKEEPISTVNKQVQLRP